MTISSYSRFPTDSGREQGLRAAGAGAGGGGHQGSCAAFTPHPGPPPGRPAQVPCSPDRHLALDFCALTAGACQQAQNPVLHH